MKCLLIVNTQSGNSRSAPEEGALLCALKKEFSEVQTLHLTRGVCCDVKSKVRGFDALVVCGGDGTLSSVLNAIGTLEIPIRYYPSGTVNDAARSAKALGGGTACAQTFHPLCFGSRLFSYVAATGTFTSIGWLPSEKLKKTFGRLAYLIYAVKEYKVHNLEAQIDIDGKRFSGTYTLIMAMRSKYVFALPVNRTFSAGDTSPKYLLIKSPRGPFGLITLFFLFFRSFIVGFRAPYHSKRIDFDSFKTLSISLYAPCDFCIDGEREPCVKTATIGVSPTKRCVSINAERQAKLHLGRLTKAKGKL